MDLQFSQIDNAVRLIKLHGKLDTAGVGQIETKFAGYCSGDEVRVLIELAEVEFLASIGIRLLLLTAKSVATRGGKMVLLSPTPDVGNVLELTAIQTIIPICESLESAQATVLA